MNTLPDTVSPSRSQESFFGRSVAGSAGGRLSDARFKFHISTAIRKAGQIASLGTVGSNNGNVTRVSYWRTSCRIERNVTSPQYDTGLEPISDFLAGAARRTTLWDWSEADQALYPRRFDQYSLDDIKKMSVGGRRGVVDHFSDKSRARLKFAAGNSFPHLISQFCLTYGPGSVPKTGRESKKHLNTFLTALRRKFPGVAYLWILEFQEKRKDAKAAHYHLFLPFEASRDVRNWLARKWVDIVQPPISQDLGSLLPWVHVERKKMYMVHNSAKNFIPWNMGKGSYLTKYLTKERQKEVPEGFDSVGRFWGTSRGLVPAAEIFHVEQELYPIVFTDKLTGEQLEHHPSRVIVRYLRRHHEAQLRSMGIRRKSRVRKKHLSKVNLPSGGRVIHAYLTWLSREMKRLAIPFENQF